MPLHSPQGAHQHRAAQSQSYYTLMNPGHSLAFHHQQQQQQQQNSNNLPLSGAPPGGPQNPHMTPTFSSPNLTQAVAQQQAAAALRNKNNFLRESQGQQSVRGMIQNQMMAPSMPNIAHPSGYASGIQASQSMQNVNGSYGLHQHQSAQQLQQQQQQQLQQQHYVDRPPMDPRLVAAQQNFAPRGGSIKGKILVNPSESTVLKEQPVYHHAETILFVSFSNISKIIKN